MDKIYLDVDDLRIIFLDCTRLDGSRELVSRNNVNKLDDVNNQIKIIAYILKNSGLSEIVLADDVVFSGVVLRTIIALFKQYGITVVGIRSAISTLESYIRFNEELAYGIKCAYLLGSKVIDQICERDFYFGIAQSGISVKDKDGYVYKAPYFKPYGDPVKRASIPEIYEKKFSLGCLKRSILLWQEIELFSKRNILISDLPERIISTDMDEEVVRVLKKGIDLL